MKLNLCRSAAIILVTAIMLLSALFFYSSNRAPDDAFISLRYARNFAAGEGLRFNPGGERVEGFSSPLHVLAMGSALALGAPPLQVGQFSSVFGAVFCVGVLAWWGQRRLGFWWGSLAAVAVALNPSLGFWARGGLETTLFASLVVMTMIAAVEEKWKTLGILAGLLAIARPEGPLYWLALALYVVLCHRRDLKNFLIPGLLWVAAWLPWFLFRILYFGDILPNTYYAKMDGVRSAQTQQGLDYLGRFLARDEILIPLILIGISLAALLRKRRSRKIHLPSWPLLAMAMVGASCGFAVLAGGDHMHHFRFLIPAIPLVMVLAAWSAAELAKLSPNRPGSIVLSLGLSLVFLSQPVRIASHDLRHPFFPLDRPIALVEPFDDWPIQRFFQLGLKLKDMLPADAVIAVVPAGAIPYASGLNTIDMLGLNDRQIARQRVESIGTGRMGHEKGNGELVLEREPAVILLRHHVNPMAGVPCDPDSSDLAYRPVRDIWETESFHEDYESFVVTIDETATYTLFRRRNRGH